MLKYHLILKKERLNMEILKIWLAKTIYGITIESILIAFIIFFTILVLRSILSKIVINILRFLASKTESKVDDKLINVLESPFRFSFIIFGFYLAQNYLNLSKYAIYIDKLISSLIIFTIFWIIYKIVNEFNALISLFSSKMGQPLNKDIENFIIKSCRVIIVIFCFLMILQAWGVNITAFIASLGLGGLAFALAAKDTTANLFGSLVIFADRPFRIGDAVEINAIEGIVEDIGIRSTRIRTYPRSLVTIPNAVVANASIANWSKRTRRKCELMIGLTYDTTSEQLEAIVSQIDQMIRERGDVYNDSLVVFFENFGDSALNIMCQYHTKTTDFKEFLQVKQEINIQIMHIVEKNGSDFAFPTQTLHVDSIKQNLKLSGEK